MVGLRWHCASALIDGTLAGANGAQGGHRSAVLLGNIRHSHRLFADIHAELGGVQNELDRTDATHGGNTAGNSGGIFRGTSELTILDDS
jgi:hypothetical protein